ncbi:hypothetical protein CEP53_003723 [Fusarium sp. AF-6]|nr:hypothetical protein CEP53_003723 [Fusarium sp. AF-6]
MLFRLSFVANRPSIRQTCYTHFPESRLDSTAYKLPICSDSENLDASPSRLTSTPTGKYGYSVALSR